MSQTKQITTEFKLNRNNLECYAVNGRIRTYANKTQADKVVNELLENGLNVCRSFSWPFIIFKSEEL